MATVATPLQTWYLRFKKSLVNMNERFTDEEKLREYVDQIGRMPEGYPVGPALASGSEFFVGREREIGLLIELIKTGKSVLIYGDRRSGKSSLLNQIIYRALSTLPNFYFSDPKDIKFLVNYDLRDYSDEGIKRRIGEIVDQKAKLGREYSKYVFVFDESSEAWVLSRLTDLPRLISEVISTSPDQIVFLLAGHRSIESMHNQSIEKNAVLPRKKMRRFLITLKQTFSMGQQTFSLPDWYPKNEIYLEPIVPREKLIPRVV